MKKILILLVLLSFLTSCGNQNNKFEKEISKNNTVGNGKVEEVNNVGIIDDLIPVQREVISLDDISKMYTLKDYTSKNKLEEYGMQFIRELNENNKNTFIDNINGGLDVESLNEIISKYPKNLVRDFNLELTIKDFRLKNKIKDGIVYSNGIKLGEFKNGKFNGQFKWLKGIEKFIITVRSDGYGDAFIILNSINSDGSLLLGDVYMKASKEKEITLGTKQKIDFNNTIIELKDCSIVDKKGDCIKGNVKLKINFINGEEANNYMVSLNREAITKEGEIVTLTSGGMSFIDFIGDNGDIYKLKSGEEIKISYKVAAENIEKMANRKNGEGKKEGYWWYDKNSGIWREASALYSIDKKNKVWSATVSNLY